VKFVPFTTQHFPVLASWFSSEADVVQWGGPFLRFPLDDSQLQVLLDECKTEPPRRLAWMAEVDGSLIGHIELGLDWRNGNATVQRVIIAPACRGRGLAEPMLRFVVDQAFSIPEIDRLELNVYSFNTAAIKTYKKVGFVNEGNRRSSTRVGDERWDNVIMSILRAEYSGKTH